MGQDTLGYWIWFISVGGAIGWMAGLITRGRGFGIIGDIEIGIAGAMLGGWMAEMMGVSIGSSYGELMMTVSGAMVLVSLTRFIVRQA